eukprot:TRINITY_DN2573_c0_g3_i3.p1 TRINITY_DN2573_c0_g3~~TRINITY_DN2573_c0_g3_i3.p1  ORF type:complete len:258 (+),score=60.66 TRINITY_DN2573_c0_g3_i3:286-1059(+)
MSWMEVVLPFLEHYTERTPGSFIEKKQASIVWHYRVCDPEYSAFQAQELLLQIQSVSAKFPIEVFLGKKAIEVKPKGIGEGYMIKKIIGNRLKASDKEERIDFLLCIGDGKADEDMFVALDEVLFEQVQDTGDFISHPISCFTTTIRRKTKTNARFYIPNQPAVIDLLDKVSSPTRFSSPIVVPPQTKIMSMDIKNAATSKLQIKNPLPTPVTDTTITSPLKVKSIPTDPHKSDKKKKRTHHLADLMSKMLGNGKFY